MKNIMYFVARRQSNAKSDVRHDMRDLEWTGNAQMLTSLTMRGIRTMRKTDKDEIANLETWFAKNTIINGSETIAERVKIGTQTTNKRLRFFRCASVRYIDRGVSDGSGMKSVVEVKQRIDTTRQTASIDRHLDGRQSCHPVRRI